MSPDKLTYMANQVGRFFAHQPHEQAVAATEDHLRKFWDPRMRAAIITALGYRAASLIRWCGRRLNGCAPADILVVAELRFRSITKRQK